MQKEIINLKQQINENQFSMTLKNQHREMGDDGDLSFKGSPDGHIGISNRIHTEGNQMYHSNQSGNNEM